MAKVYCEVMQDIQVGPIQKQTLPDGSERVYDFTKLYKKGQLDWFDEKLFADHDHSKRTEYKNAKGLVVSVRQGELRRVVAPGSEMLEGSVSKVPLVVPDNEAI